MHTCLPLPHIQAIVVPNAALLWRRCLVVVATMLVASALPQGVKAQDGDYGNGNTAEGTFALKAIVSNSGNTGSFTPRSQRRYVHIGSLVSIAYKLRS